MAFRLESFGVPKGIAETIESNLSPELMAKAAGWISSIVGKGEGEPGEGAGGFQSWLKNGAVLCKLMNKLRPGSVEKVNETEEPAGAVENIKNFLSASEDYGVPKSDLFKPADLMEGKDMPQVVNGILSLAKTSQSKGDESAGGGGLLETGLGMLGGGGGGGGFGNIF